jgi:hypothetical protein
MTAPQPERSRRFHQLTSKGDRGPDQLELSTTPLNENAINVSTFGSQPHGQDRRAERSPILA